jgi:uncharacterized protein (DUF433 family)
MQLEDYFEFHAKPVEYIRIKGTRIDIDFVIDLYKRHMTPAQIAVHFGCPLDLVQVYATITYYLQNTREVEAYLASREVRARELIADARQQQPSPAVVRIRELKKRFTDSDGNLDYSALKQYMEQQRGNMVAAQ